MSHKAVPALTQQQGSVPAVGIVIIMWGTGVYQTWYRDHFAQFTTHLEPAHIVRDLIHSFSTKEYVWLSKKKIREITKYLKLRQSLLLLIAILESRTFSSNPTQMDNHQQPKTVVLALSPIFHHLRSR